MFIHLQQDMRNYRRLRRGQISRQFGLSLHDSDQQPFPIYRYVPPSSLLPGPSRRLTADESYRKVLMHQSCRFLLVLVSKLVSTVETSSIEWNF